MVYSGDTHAAYAAMMQAEDGSYLGAEYSAPGVSSPSFESGSRVPLELHNAAALVAKNVRTLLVLACVVSNVRKQKMCPCLLHGECTHFGLTSCLI